MIMECAEVTLKVKRLASDERIWAGDHADAPVARTGGLLKAEEDNGRQLREWHHDSAQVTADADIITRTHFLNDVIGLCQAVLLVLPCHC